MTEEQVKKGSELSAKIEELRSRVIVLGHIKNNPETDIRKFSFDINATYKVLNKLDVVSNINGTDCIGSEMSVSNNLTSIKSAMMPELMDEAIEFSNRILKIFNKQIKLLEKELKEL